MEKVTFGDASIPGYECGDKSAPAVVVLQEWWGVTETIKRQALKLHTDGGFRVIVPDLYKGELGVDAEEAHHLMTNLDWGGAAGACPPRDVSRPSPSPKNRASVRRPPIPRRR